MASAGAGGGGGGAGNNEIDISNVPLEGLRSMQKQMQAEQDQLVRSFQGLKVAEEKFMASKEAVEYFEPSKEGKEILVPLTSSLYVPGKLASASKVLVDVGTGYYMEKSIDEAKAFFDKKAKLLKTNTTNLEKTIGVRNENLRQINIAIQQRTQQALAAQAAAGSR